MSRVGDSSTMTTSGCRRSTQSWISVACSMTPTPAALAHQFIAQQVEAMGAVVDEQHAQAGMRGMRGGGLATGAGGGFTPITAQVPCRVRPPPRRDAGQGTP